MQQIMRRSKCIQCNACTEALSRYDINISGDNMSVDDEYEEILDILYFGMQYDGFTCPVDALVMETSHSARLTFAYTEALSNIGSLEGVKQLADQGNPEMQFVFAVDFAIQESPHEAFHWFEKAALQGHVIAQYCLGNCYSDGVGVESDREQAMFWWKLASEQGYSEAKEALSKEQRSIEYEKNQAQRKLIAQGICPECRRKISGVLKKKCNFCGWRQ